MNLLIVSLVIILSPPAELEQPRYPILRCQYDGLKYQCTTVNYLRNQTQKFSEKLCINEEECKDCVKVWNTKAEIKPDDLIQPSQFIVRQNDDPNGQGIRYECTDKVGSCGCQTRNCTGTLEYCKKNFCVNSSECHCNVKTTTNVMILLHKNSLYTNVVLYSYVTCSYRIPIMVKTIVFPSRKLLSDEKAVFTEKDVTVRFNDPVVTVDQPGTLVIRKDGLERVFNVKDSFGQVVIPEELLLDNGILKVIFVALNGQTVKADIRIEGRQFCTRFTCILCIQVWYQLNCLPPIVQYVVYAILILITILLILYVHKVVRVIWQTLVGMYIIGKQIVRGMKALGRCSLLAGLVAGRTTQRALHEAQRSIEDRARQINNNGRQPAGRVPLLLLLTLFAVIQTNSIGTNAECTNHMIQKTSLKQCTNDKTGQTKQ